LITLFEQYSKKKYRSIHLSPYLIKALNDFKNLNFKNIEEVASDWCNKNLVDQIIFFKNKKKTPPFIFKSSKVLKNTDIRVVSDEGFHYDATLIELCYTMYVKVKVNDDYNKDFDPYGEEDWDMPNFD